MGSSAASAMSAQCGLQVSLAQLQNMAVNHVAQYYSPPSQSTGVPHMPPPAAGAADAAASTARTTATSTRHITSHSTGQPAVTRIGFVAPPRLPTPIAAEPAAPWPTRDARGFQQDGVSNSTHSALLPCLDAANSEQRFFYSTSVAVDDSVPEACGLKGPPTEVEEEEPPSAAPPAAASGHDGLLAHQLMTTPADVAAFNRAILSGARSDAEVARAMGATARGTVRPHRHYALARVVHLTIHCNPVFHMHHQQIPMDVIAYRRSRMILHCDLDSKLPSPKRQLRS